MRTHVQRTVSSCFAVLHQLRSIRRSVSRPVMMSLVVWLVLTRLDYGSATLAGLPNILLNRLQSKLNAAARLVYCARQHNYTTPLLRDLHWLRVPDCIAFRLAVLVYRCQHDIGPSYLSAELHRVVDVNRVAGFSLRLQQRLLFHKHCTRRSATEHSRLRQRACGTHYHSASRHHRRWQLSDGGLRLNLLAVVWRWRQLIWY